MYYQSLDFGDLSNSQNFAKAGKYADLQTVIFNSCALHSRLPYAVSDKKGPLFFTIADIGQALFGTAGELDLSIILYVELYACCVEYIILDGDNLSSLFPNAHISLGGFELNSQGLFALMTTLAVLPTVWLRDLSVLSYISCKKHIDLWWSHCINLGGTLLVLGWLGRSSWLSNKGTTLNLVSLPVAVGLDGYCYSGHAVFPNIYTSMAKPNQFPSVLLACFGIYSLLYAGTAIMGYTMFGEATESQFTLNMPKDLIASRIVVWTTVVNPFTKYLFHYSSLHYYLESAY
ncbi:hypothetical protein SCA6_000586 [Theobroma cacao]